MPKARTRSTTKSWPGHKKALSAWVMRARSWAAVAVHEEESSRRQSW